MGGGDEFDGFFGGEFVGVGGDVGGDEFVDVGGDEFGDVGGGEFGDVGCDVGGGKGGNGGPTLACRRSGGERVGMNIPTIISITAAWRSDNGEPRRPR